MNRKSTKTVIATLIGGLSLLICAGIILIVLAITQNWDVVGALTSPVAFLWYALIVIGSVFLVKFIVQYRTIGR